MKAKPSKFLEQHRTREGIRASDESYGNNGDFTIEYNDILLCVTASSDKGWDHVSVHARPHAAGVRTPTWDEMDYIRRLFFRGDEWVIQYHAPAEKHIEKHLHVLHLWRPQKEEVPIPPSWMV